MSIFEEIEKNERIYMVPDSDTKEMKEQRKELISHIVPVLNSVDKKDKERLSLLLDLCSKEDSLIEIVYSAGGSLQRGTLKNFMKAMGYDDIASNPANGYTAKQKEFLTFAMAVAAKDSNVTFEYKEHNTSGVKAKEFAFLYTDTRKLSVKAGIFDKLVDYILGLFGVKSERVLAQEAHAAAKKFGDKVFAGTKENQKNINSAAEKVFSGSTTNFHNNEPMLRALVPEEQKNNYLRGIQNLSAIINRGGRYAEQLMMLNADDIDVSAADMQKSLYASAAAGALLRKLENDKLGEQEKLTLISTIAKLGSVSPMATEDALFSYYKENVTQKSDTKFVMSVAFEKNDTEYGKLQKLKSSVAQVVQQNFGDYTTINIKEDIGEEERLNLFMPQICAGVEECGAKSIHSYIEEHDIYKDMQLHARQTDEFHKRSADVANPDAEIGVGQS